ncbi:MAG: methylthioribose-1-phosphate isomerase [Actinomycetes bacterium]
MTSVPTLEYSVKLDDDGVRILDRRVFPLEERWVLCPTVEDVAVAIEQMVTQSLGPLFAATAGMQLAARQVAQVSRDDASARDAMHAAGARLINTRRTNNHIRDGVTQVLLAIDAVDVLDPQTLITVVADTCTETEQLYRHSCELLGRHAASLIPNGTRLLTHCWADLYLIGLVKALIASETDVEFLCTETRPYLQGARLTAHTLGEMGYQPTVLTDGMPAWAMQQGMVDVVVTAADRVTMDGHVVNKIGTLQTAISAAAFDIPFHVLIQAPDLLTPTINDMTIEMRDGNEVLSLMGTRTASPLARGIYPAFDATPPRWVTDVSTDRGVFTPEEIGEYYAKSE